MARPKTDAYWVAFVSTAAEEGYKPPAIARMVQEEARAKGRSDWPSERTVRRLYDEHQKLLDDSERRQQARFTWPRSMELAPSLEWFPWGAGRLLLDFVLFCEQNGLERPTVRQAKWFWRLHLAAPDMPISVASFFARTLSTDEYFRVAKLPGSAGGDLTMFLAYQPWKGKTERQQFEEAIKRLGPQYNPAIRFTGLEVTGALFKEQGSGLSSYVKDAELAGGFRKEQESGNDAAIQIPYGHLDKLEEDTGNG